MNLSTPYEALLRLVLAAALGYLIGLERAHKGQPAGERTHALTSLGAATAALLSFEGIFGADQARVSAAVVTGLGFLGAGMIIKTKGKEVHGLTTAAGIWAVGIVGLAIGVGQYMLGLGSAALIFLILALERIYNLDAKFKELRDQKDDDE